jgi:hypothetical protein
MRSADSPQSSHFAWFACQEHLAGGPAGPLNGRNGNGCSRRQSGATTPEVAMFDDMEVNAQDLAIDEIRELLLEAGANITLAQAEQLATFITQSGGLDEAREVMSHLSQLRDAA